MRSPSENRSSTLVRPFIKEIFSSRDFAAKFDRSRKLSVDIGSDEKNACDGSVDGDGRLWECRVMRVFNRTGDGSDEQPICIWKSGIFTSQVRI